MATELRPRNQEPRLLSEETTSFNNIEATFPEIFDKGIDLLQKTIGKIQVMRLEAEVFPSLIIEGNKTSIREKEADYKEISNDVAEYRRSLQTVNGQIERAIELCSKVPFSDVRVWQQGEEAVKIYDLCQQYIPILRDKKTLGTLLDKRFDLIMNYDPKNYTDSMSKFSSAINPSSSTLFSSVTGFFTGWGASSASSDEVDLTELSLQAEKKK